MIYVCAECGQPIGALIEHREADGVLAWCPEHCPGPEVCDLPEEHA